MLTTQMSETKSSLNHNTKKRSTMKTKMIFLKGQRFKTTFNKEIYTAKSFFGKSGIEYDTATKAAKANSISLQKVLVKNIEYGGACEIENTIPIS